MEPIKLIIPATIDQAQLGVIAVRNIAAAYYEIETGKKPGKENTFLDQVELAVGEACTNSAQHGSTKNSEDGRIVVMFFVEEDHLTIMVKDRNAPFDFANIRPPNLDETPESGYGIFLMKEMMDEVTCLRKDGWNILQLKKRFNTEE